LRKKQDDYYVLSKLMDYVCVEYLQTVCSWFFKSPLLFRKGKNKVLIHRSIFKERVCREINDVLCKMWMNEPFLPKMFHFSVSQKNRLAPKTDSHGTLFWTRNQVCWMFEIMVGHFLNIRVRVYDDPTFGISNSLCYMVEVNEKDRDTLLELSYSRLKNKDGGLTSDEKTQFNVLRYCMDFARPTLKWDKYTGITGYETLAENDIRDPNEPFCPKILNEEVDMDPTTDEEKNGGQEEGMRPPFLPPRRTHFSQKNLSLKNPHSLSQSVSQ
jgi:hypothetical protein